MRTDGRRWQRLIEERGEDYAGLSRLIGRNPAYIQQLSSAARRGGWPRPTGGCSPAISASRKPCSAAPAAAPGRGLTPVPRLDVDASAGAGAFDGDESGESHIAFDPAWLRRIARGAPDQLSIIRVAGDSMAPTLADGDDILVDRGDGAARLRDGIYVLRIDDALVVKRVALSPAARTVSIRTDNPAYPGWPDCDPAAVDIVGRVVWTGRRIG